MENIMDIASQELTDEQIKNISDLSSSIAVSSNIENIVTGGQNYDKIIYHRKKMTVRDYPKIGRNDLCPCGSGKKYKNCCIHTGNYETTHQK